MRLALAISILVVAGTAVFAVTAAFDTSVRRRESVAYAQSAPCPTNTPPAASQAAPAAQSAVVAAPTRVTMPETGNAGLLPGSRHVSAFQSTAACPAATPSAAATPPPATQSATPTAALVKTATPIVNIPSSGGGGAIGGGGIGVGSGGYGY